MTDELFKKIRKGNEEEARKVYENLRGTTMRGVAVAIMMRNFSHNLGAKIKEVI